MPHLLKNTLNTRDSLHIKTFLTLRYSLIHILLSNFTVNQVIFLAFKSSSKHISNKKRLCLAKSSVSPHTDLVCRAPHCTLHLGVPQTVYEGVQHRIKETVKQRQHFLLFLSFTGVWNHINHHGSTKEKPNHTEV